MNIVNKCAICIPIHPKHYTYGYNIINELEDTNVDLYFIFTNLQDKELFTNTLSENYKLNFLLLSDFTIAYNLITYKRSFVPLKKLYALLKLYNKYDYISCIDSEIQFIKKNIFYEIMKNIVDSKIICGGILDDNMSEIKIMKETLTAITPENDHSKLQKLSNDFKIYTWWSNLPVYDCKKAEHFLKWINFDNTFFCLKLNWYVFDDMLYNYFCILFYDYKLLIIPNIHHSLEFSNSKIVEYVNTNMCKLYWVNFNAYKQNSEYYKKNNFIIVYHLDRIDFPIY